MLYVDIAVGSNLTYSTVFIRLRGITSRSVIDLIISFLDTATAIESLTFNRKSAICFKYTHTDLLMLILWCLGIHGYCDVDSK